MELITLLGEGSFGAVYKARFRGSIIALKWLSSSSTSENEEYEQILKEAELMRKFRHPNVIMLMGIIKTKSKGIFIASEYAPFGDLDSYVKKLQKNKSENSPSITIEKLNYLSGICKGMSYLHAKNIIHRFHLSLRANIIICRKLIIFLFVFT